MGINYISYSGYKLYEKCPFAFWHQYILKTLVPENGLNSLYGSVVGIIFEVFFRDKLWRVPNLIDTLHSLVEPTLKKVIDEQVSKGRVIDWADPKAIYPCRSKLLEDIHDTLPRGLEAIKKNSLMGPRMDAELKLDSKFGKYVVGGRADFVIQRVRPFSDLVILDGKGSKHREKYVDGHALKAGGKVEGTQLKWYSFLYKERFGALPDKLGYLFWKFEGERAIEWVPFTSEEVDDLRELVLTTLKRIDRSESRIKEQEGKPQAQDDLRQELFGTQPGFGCGLCQFNTICEDGKKKVRAQQRDKPKLPSGVEEITLGPDD